MSHSVPIGICASPSSLAEIAPGYDYLEAGVVGQLQPLEPDDVFEQTRPELMALVPPIRALNLFAPRELRLTGPDVDWPTVERYAETAVKRAASLGAKVIIVGSGGSRRVPEGYSRALAWGQLVRLFTRAADEAEAAGLEIAIEPLNSRECNIINSYAEGVQLAKDVGRKPIRVLADIYHMQEEGESLDAIAKEPSWLAHVHLADSGRRYPGSGQYPLAELFTLLGEIDYKGMASIECSWGDDRADESRKALDFLRTVV